MIKKILAIMVLFSVVAAAAGCGSGKENSGAQSAWETIPGAQGGGNATVEETAADAAENGETAGGAGEGEAANTAAEEADADADTKPGNSVGALYTGTWVDEIAGRAYMVIREAPDGTYDVEINWSSSAAEDNAWRINAVIDERNGNLVYDNGTYQKILFHEDGESEIVEEKQVSGSFTYAEGGVHWIDSVEHADFPDDPTTFIREGDAVPPDTGDGSGRQEGDRFEGVVTVEGMEEAVHYEYIVNETVGIGMGFDYELFERRSSADRECFVSVYDDPKDPENYFEVTYSPEDPETAAASISEELSKEYGVDRGETTLDGAGSCIRIDASADKNGMMTLDELHMVYIIPADDGCRIAWAHYGMESADGFGARFRGMANTIDVIKRN